MTDIAKTYLSADNYLKDIWSLAAAVRKSGWKPDALLALWRGGAPVGVAIHEFLQVTGWNVAHYPVKCSSYSGIDKSGGHVRFEGEDGVWRHISPGSRVLVVDDVFDSGTTAKTMKEKLESVGVEMRMACVYWKPERNKTDLKPDYFVRDSDLNWIVYPHEIAGLTSEEIVIKDPFLAGLIEDARQA